MKNARRYKLFVDTIKSCGLGTLGSEAIEYNLLNTFTVDGSQIQTDDPIPTGSYTYPTISVEELQRLSVINYNKRVLDFLSFLGIDDIIIRNNLIEYSTFDESNCDLACGLNPDFTIYKFLTGIRIINIGTISGTAEYKVYPDGSNPELYTWKTSPTFLNLIVGEKYVAVVRDIVDGIVACEFSNDFVMGLIQPSTTQAFRPIHFGISELTSGNAGNLYFKNGKIEINPPLSNDESVVVNYSTLTSLIGRGSSSVILSCKPNGYTEYLQFEDINNLNGSVNRKSSFELTVGDSVCYNISAFASTNGSFAESCLAITSICGDNISCVLNNSFSHISSVCAKQNNYVSIFETDSGTLSDSFSSRSGIIEIGTPIPIDEYINVKLKSTLLSTNGGKSNVTFFSKLNDTSAFLQICSVENTTEQPQYPIFKLYRGDELCWSETLSAPIIGSSASNHISIDSLDASMGVNPLIHPTRNYIINSISNSI